MELGVITLTKKKSLKLIKLHFYLQIRHDTGKLECYASSGFH